jgi:hypothetical protein
LEHEYGRLRFELVDGDCWRTWTVAIDDGNVTVDHDNANADGVVRADLRLFDRAVAGEEQLLPAVLRGEVSLNGSYGLIIQFSRLLPGPAGQAGPRKVGNTRGRSE